MADQSRENVPRGDHVPDEEREENDAKADRAEPGIDSAAHRGHGAHGKGVGGREEHEDPASPSPDISKGSDRGGNSGWGGAPSGGSVIDKRKNKD